MKDKPNHNNRQKQTKTSAGAELLQRFCMFATCLLMLLAVVMLRDRSAFGHQIDAPAEDNLPQSEITVNSGEIVVDTSTLSRDIIGYGGPTPLTVTFVDGQIASVEAQRNAETPGFMRRVEQGLFPRFIGMTAAEAADCDVDAISGATFTSVAVIRNIRIAGAEAAGIAAEIAPAADEAEIFTPGYVASLIVVLAGAIIPLLVKSKKYRIVQLVVNLAVLGFWTATFINYTVMLRLLSSGVNVAASLVVLAMLVVAFIYPFFGKKDHYCTWICPLGSMQELALMFNRKRRITLSPAAVKWLGWFRQALWAVLMLLMWTQVWFGWIDYELFSAFVVSSASTFVIVGAALILLLSFFVMRPYCRFVCPTGTLFKISEN